MVTICTPNYHNIFIEKFERNFIYPYHQTFSNFYGQFIDDIFLLWQENQKRNN